MFEIIQPTPEDKQEIFDLYKKTWLDTYISDEFSISESDIKKFFKTMQPDEIKIENIEGSVIRVIVRVGGKIVATSHANVLKDTEGVGYVKTLYIDPEYQRQGIGSALLLYIKTHLYGIQQIVLETAVYNKKGIDFYVKNGFAVDKDFQGEFKLTEGKSIPIVRLVLNI